MNKLSVGLLCGGLIFLPGAAVAYIGPGAGLSLLGALWALLLAVATALAFVVAWPVRRMLRRRREARAQAEADSKQSPSGDNAGLVASEARTPHHDVGRSPRQ